mmetsp:Transcript_6393/g.19333  ORF Transcript_6393/g.19333 Transcript_6393/m.19333 type:complete len:237 (-) Transcript_6393:2974-3684(-)
MGKRAAATDDETLVMTYMSRQNRPFSLQQVVDALQSSGLKKTGCERALMSLVEKEKVTMKEFGKAKIFLCRQENIDMPSEDEMKKLDEDVRTATEELEQLDEQFVELAESVNKLKSTMSIEEARAKSDELNRDIAAFEEKLASFGPHRKQVTQEEKDAIESLYTRMRDEWRKRQRMAKDIVNMISEGLGKKPSELNEEMGIETDEAAGVSMDEMPVLNANRGSLSRSRPSKRPRVS